MNTSEERDHGAGVASPRNGYHSVAGERGIMAVHRIRSLESRIGSLTAFGLVGLLGFALLAWYYHAALERPVRHERSAAARAQNRAQREMMLPPLGPVVAPTQRTATTETHVPASASRATAAASRSEATLASQRARVSLPLSQAYLARTPRLAKAVVPTIPRGPQVPSAREEALHRQLSGPVFTTRRGRLGRAQMPSGAERGPPPAQRLPFSGASEAAQPVTSRSDDLEQRLKPTATPAAVAQVLPSRDLVLPKGSFIDCTLETAIDSTLPGMTTCITATDTFGADGKVVLLERGSQLVGETHGVVEQGSARVFVLWTQARTPTGVVIQLASPGTDALGRSGLAGRVDRHFWQRFGAAMLISVVDAGVQSIAHSGRGAIIYDPAESQGVATEVLRHTLRIPPRVIVDPGERIEVLVARNLDFRSVYALRTVSPRR